MKSRRSYCYFVKSVSFVVKIWLLLPGFIILFLCNNLSCDVYIQTLLLPGPNTFNENETIAKYEIMDGAPVKGRHEVQMFRVYENIGSTCVFMP